MYLLQDFIFNTLKIEEIFGFMYADNKRVIHFNKQFGGVIGEPVMDENGRMIRYGKNNRQRFNEYVPGIKRMLYGIER